MQPKPFCEVLALKKHFWLRSTRTDLRFSFSRLLSLCLISHGWFIWARIIGLICIAGINYFRVPAVSLAHPTGEEAGLRLLGAVRRGAAGSGSALHLYLSARVEGTCNVPDVLPIKTSVYRFDWTEDSSDSKSTDCQRLDGFWFYLYLVLSKNLLLS